MTEITTLAGVVIVTEVVIILTTILLVIATKVFSPSGSRDISGGDVPIIPDTSSSSPSSGSWKYDVFLSFRGEDTRKTFVDHLYSAFQQHAILTYKDDVTLDRGDTIGSSLLKAIQQSHIALIVFSEKYADSSWCLEELSHIMKCNKERGQIVMPIFYKVDPTDVRKQKGQFGKSFAKHNDKKKVESWKQALVDASNIAGWESTYVVNGYEAKFIQVIVDSVLGKMASLNRVTNDENLVGMRDRLKDLKSQLRIGSRGVHMVGIWGIGGGGKTTLATSLYTDLKISGDFDGYCLVANIRAESEQKGLKGLQEQILSTIFGKKMKVESVEIGKQKIESILCDRNVLIVLDDIDHLDQLRALAGSLSWFGDRSRIIITTRDRHLLETHQVVVFPINLLSPDEAIRLFKKHSYHEDKHVHDYEMLSQQIVSYARGLPLALIVLGSFLYDKNYDEWLSTLARLKDHPELDILGKLKISYDGLKPVEKDLFPDIACFHRGMDKDEAMAILDACGFNPVIGVKVLIQKALITVSSRGKFDMHDLIQEMGHYIVKREHPNNPEKHSRLWRKEDIEDICSTNAKEENDKIEGLQYCYGHGYSSFNMLVSNMKKLRFLLVWIGSNYDRGPSFLSNELRYFDWNGYPASLFPESFQPRKLSILKMGYSLQKELWKGHKYLPCLKMLELHGAKALERTPDIGGLPCLRKLKISECESLEEIHESLGNHSSLVYVDVMSCEKLTRFPSLIGMEKLETLRIIRCKKLAEFPKIEAKMDNLVKLSLDCVGIVVLPSSVGEYCTNLTLLTLKECSNLKSIEGNFHALKCLKKFELSGCSQFEKWPKDLFNENLDELHLSKSSVKRLNFSHLPRSLRTLDLSKCGLKDREIPNEVGELSNLQELHLSYNHFTRLEFSLSRLTRLKLLNLSDCENLVELPELPSSLAIFKADGCNSLEGNIRDEIYTNCKCLSQVSITGGNWGKNIIGGERLLETMLLQGNGDESQCMSLTLKGLELARGFEAKQCFGQGIMYRMHLPENWDNGFSGFLFCAAFDKYGSFGETITISHVRKFVGRWRGNRDSQHDWNDFVDDDEDDIWGSDTALSDGYNGIWDDAYGSWNTWVGYIPFSVLRHTSWWDPTSTSIQIEMEAADDLNNIRGFGFKRVPKRGGQMETDAHFSAFSVDHYNCKLHIEHDSKSALECRFDHYESEPGGDREA